MVQTSTKEKTDKRKSLNSKNGVPPANLEGIEIKPVQFVTSKKKVQK
jgi:hypothetical protein